MLFDHSPSQPYNTRLLPAKFPELGRQWNIQNPCQPNPGLRADEKPCTSGVFVFLGATGVAYILKSSIITSHDTKEA